MADMPPMKIGEEWDAGQNGDGPMSQRGRWTVKREAKRIIVVYHFFFPKSEKLIKSFGVEEEAAAKEYARQCCEKKTIPQK
jgi:hypothetical protein